MPNAPICSPAVVHVVGWLAAMPGKEADGSCETEPEL